MVIAAVIPARNEAAKIGRAVTALRREGVRHVLVLANDCIDATLARAEAAGAYVVSTGRLAGGVGSARRLGCAEAMRRWPAAQVLITTDADGHVERGSVAAARGALVAADAVMGRVLPEATEFDALPEPVRRLGDLETRRDAMLAEIGAICAPRAHDPTPRHLFTSGAFMAFRRAAYVASGGFGDLPCDEDKDLGARLMRLGMRIARPWGAAVTVSCRTAGRAPDGMAVCISKRSREDLGPRIALVETQCDRLQRILRSVREMGRPALDELTALCTEPASVSAMRCPPSAAGDGRTRHA